MKSATTCTPSTRKIRSCGATSVSPGGCSLSSTTTGASPSCSTDRKSTRLNSSHLVISYAVFCLKKHKGQLYTCGRVLALFRQRAFLFRFLVTANGLLQVVFAWCLPHLTVLFPRAAFAAVLFRLVH